MKSTGKHWDAVFSRTEDPQLGWYEKDASKTLELLSHVPDWKTSTVLLPGAGTSVLVEELLGRGVRLLLNDISGEALGRVKSRLGDKANDVVWLCQDIAQPIEGPIPDVDIWIDRAVLHFLIDQDDIDGYFANVKSVLKAGSHAMFAEFALTGARKCAGLEVHRYSIEELSGNLGPSFKLVSHFEYAYINPRGDPRQYIYALFRREM